MEYHNFVPITADLTGAADAYNQCHYQVSLLKSGHFLEKWTFCKKWIFLGKSGFFCKKWIFLSVSERMD